jgi:protein-L-isoaspartate(D-aspartate) O-methyltransferase
MSRPGCPAELAAAARAAGTSDERVPEAMNATPRAGFVPARDVTAAYRDEPIPIGHGQVTTQPSLPARTIEGLRLAGSDHVLEIGIGLGFQTALLARGEGAGATVACRARVAARAHRAESICLRCTRAQASNQALEQRRPIRYRCQL